MSPVSSPHRGDWYRKLPSVDRLLQRPLAVGWSERLGAERVTGEFRTALDDLRGAIQAENWDNGHPPGWSEPIEDAIESRVGRRLEALTRPSLRPVINASGVVIHTNLGRAPLAESAVQAITDVARGYSNLEYDLAEGARGKRDVHAGELLEALLGYPAIVVNNNAAAIYLVLRELAAGGEVIVSRGELIEIGDGFRIPDILESSGCTLREVGTTNRTRIGDYRAAIGEQTKALLRVHRSNFAIVGFTERASAEDLGALGRETGIPTIDDLGSGCLYDVREHGFEDAPVRETLGRWNRCSHVQWRQAVGWSAGGDHRRTGRPGEADSAEPDVSGAARGQGLPMPRWGRRCANWFLGMRTPSPCCGCCGCRST